MSCTCQNRSYQISLPQLPKQLVLSLTSEASVLSQDSQTNRTFMKQQCEKSRRSHSSQLPETALIRSRIESGLNMASLASLKAKMTVNWNVTENVTENVRICAVSNRKVLLSSLEETGIDASFECLGAFTMSHSHLPSKPPGLAGL